MKPDVTVFADASMHPGERRCGWGAWIKGDGRPSLSAGGALPFNQSTSICELEALAAALEHAERHNYFVDADKAVMLQCDNVNALGAIRGRRPAVLISDHADSALINTRKKEEPADMRAAIDRIFAVTDGAGLTVILRHVRGHMGGDGRNYVNRLCDRLAKEGRRQALPNPCWRTLQAITATAGGASR